MSDLGALYRELILDHGRRPRNFGRLEGATHDAEGDNPLCGDRIRVELAIDGSTVSDARFEGEGCAIATASASLMTETLRGMTTQDARELCAAMHETCTGQPAAGAAGGRVEIGQLAVFEGVRKHPLRAKCALLAWRTVREALGERRL